MRDKILVVDDEPNLRTILEALLSREGFDVQCFESFDHALPILNTENIDVMITDLSMPGKSGMDVLAYCQQYAPDLPVVMITAFGTIEAAVDALKAGAFDFVLKPFDPKDLVRILKKAIESRRRRKREPQLDLINSVTASGVGPVPVPLFGDQESTQSLREEVKKAALHQSPMVIEGEIGSGKRSVAYEIHRHSIRARKPFVQNHCEAVAEVFQASELFGIEKGALPLSLFSKPGSLELANEGTLVLEEIGALSYEVQNELFSSLDNEFFRRVGGVKRFPWDIRLIVTSSKDLSRLVQEGKFHPELYFKLSVQTIELKPLRERRKDIQTHLVPYFIQRACQKRGVPVLGCADDCRLWFQRQNWPGNLGQLERTIEKMVQEAVLRKLNQIDSSLLVLGDPSRI